MDVQRTTPGAFQRRSGRFRQAPEQPLSNARTDSCRTRRPADPACVAHIANRVGRGIRICLCLAVLWASAVPALRAAVILQYHHVSDRTPASTSTSPERFAMHLDYLARQGFEIVPLQRLVDILRAGGPLPDRTAAITFDDGYLSIYTTAWPLLSRRGWPFTVFVNTEPHDRQQAGFMSWDQLRELSAGGATVANHTVSHPYLLERRADQDESAWRASVAAEISGAQRRIEQELGSAPALLAWPYGEYDAVILDIAGSLGFAGFGQHSGPLADYSDLRALPRFPFGGSYGDAADFAVKVNSLPLPLVPGGESIRWETPDGGPLHDIVLTESDTPPVLALRLADGLDPGRLACFASGQGSAPTRAERPWVLVQAEKPLPVGRSRYNCTAPAARPGQYFWYSQPWIVRPANGQ